MPERVNRDSREEACDRLNEAYAEAALDPAFLDDMESTTSAYDATVADGFERI